MRESGVGPHDPSERPTIEGPPPQGKRGTEQTLVTADHVEMDHEVSVGAV